MHTLQTEVNGGSQRTTGDPKRFGEVDQRHQVPHTGHQRRRSIERTRGQNRKQIPVVLGDDSFFTGARATESQRASQLKHGEVFDRPGSKHEMATADIEPQRHGLVEQLRDRQGPSYSGDHERGTSELRALPGDRNQRFGAPSVVNKSLGLITNSKHRIGEIKNDVLAGAELRCCCPPTLDNATTADLPGSNHVLDGHPCRRTLSGRRLRVDASALARPQNRLSALPKAPETTTRRCPLGDPRAEPQRTSEWPRAPAG